MPSAWDFKSLISLNLIKNNKVATEGINLAEKICSPNARSLKGKSARAKLAPVAGNVIENLDKLSNANEELKLPADRLLVNSLNYAMTTACNLFSGQCH